MIIKKKIKQAGNVVAILTNDGILFKSKITGNHLLKEFTWNERVEAHWKGFILNQPHNK